MLGAGAPGAGAAAAPAAADAETAGRFVCICARAKRPRAWCCTTRAAASSPITGTMTAGGGCDLSMAAAMKRDGLRVDILESTKEAEMSHAFSVQPGSCRRVADWAADALKDMKR